MPGETSKLYLQHLLASALSKLKLAGELNAEPDIMSPDPKFGDYATNAALALAKKLKQPPMELASKIADTIGGLDSEKVFSDVTVAGGFINFRLSPGYLQDNLVKIIDQRELYGCGVSGRGQKILMEYFQPNVAKPLHLGHLRTAIIGDSLFRILSSQGFKVESDTHLGDWGTQFGLLILAYKKYGDLKIIEQNPIEELNKLYVKINAAMETDPELREQGKAEFVKLEKGDAENRALWKKFRDWSWQEYEVIYSDLGVRRSDHDWPESFFEDKMPAVLSELRDKHLLLQSQGAQIVDLSDYKLGTAVLVKSDGGTTYLLRDLATFIYRKSRGFVKQFYVVDVRQSHTLAQTFKIMELAGHIQTPGEAVHIGYGFLTLPEGAMSTRKGTIIGAKDFINNVEQTALTVIEEKNPGLKHKAVVAKAVAAGAIKYFDLSHNLKTDIVFDPNKAVSFEGNTGPYMQYTHARIHGILRKAEKDGQTYIGDDVTQVDKDLELLVLRKLNQFPEVVELVAQDYLPNLLCNYLFELSQTFNAFYQAVPVLQEADDKIRSSRLKLITATAQVIKNGLNLLGIEAPEEM